MSDQDDEHRRMYPTEQQLHPSPSEQFVCHDSDRTAVNSRSSDPTGDNYDMDDISLSDSVTARQCENKTMHTLFGQNDYNYQTTELSISEEGLHKLLMDRSSSFSYSVLRRSRRTRPVSVQFAKDAQLYDSDYNDDDVVAMWYDRDTIDSFKQNRRDIAKLLKKHDFDLPTFDNKYCLRGYEPYTSIELNKQIRRQREVVFSTVLNEQKRQHKIALNSLGSVSRGISVASLLDHELLSKTSSECSRWAREYAQQLGAKDMKEVIREYSQDITSRNQRQLWERIIEKATDDVYECHEQQYFAAAMQYMNETTEPVMDIYLY